MTTSRNKPIEGSTWFDMHRDTLRSCQPHDFAKLSIGSQHEKALERANTGAECLTYGMEAVDHLWGIIVSIGWCHLDGPRS
jgi:hypothetical protein